MATQQQIEHLVQMLDDYQAAEVDCCWAISKLVDDKTGSMEDVEKTTEKSKALYREFYEELKRLRKNDKITLHMCEQFYYTVNWNGKSFDTDKKNLMPWQKIKVR